MDRHPSATEGELSRLRALVVNEDTLAAGPLLRPEDAARLLSVRTSWVYDAVREGKVPCIRVGRHIRFTREMLEAWIAEQTRA